MLEWLRIRNFALIEAVDIEFGSGFNVITGETGAGKSVLIGALSLLLGERADKTAIRADSERCEISAGVLLPGQLQPQIKVLLENAGLTFPGDGQLLLRRVITASSTRNFINDEPVTLNTLKEIGDVLIDMHGPHEHQSLLKNVMQLNILDNYAGLSKERQAVLAEYRKSGEICRKIADLERDVPSLLEAENLRGMIAEIDQAALQPGEDETLNSRHKMAANAREIIHLASGVVNQLNEAEGALVDQLGEVVRDLTELEKLGVPDAEDYIRQGEGLVESCRELAYSLETAGTNIELDDREFKQLEDRLQVIQTLKRKYGPSLNAVQATGEDAALRLAELDNYDELMQQYRREEKAVAKRLEKSCRQLSRKRQQAAGKFADTVSAALPKLGFLQASFTVEFAEVEAGPNGSDQVDFQFCANPGEGLLPLKKVASSGEISRVMLALKRVLATADDVPILIFDEIDVNIGGETAAVVGAELRELGETHQVLCISHLPQVAAAADRHYLVDKEVKKDRTYTRTKLLETTSRQTEIGRMLGGGKAALDHAKKLLKANL